MDTPHDRIALVTGACSGVGRATAQALVHAGWRVVYGGRRLHALREAVADAGDPFGDILDRAMVAVADITRADAVSAMFDVVRARFGRLDLLVHAAAAPAPPATVDELPADAFRAELDTAVVGAFMCTQQAFRIMKAQRPHGGRVVHCAVATPPAAGAKPVSVAAAIVRNAVAALCRASADEGRAHAIAVAQVDVAGGSADHGAAGAATVAKAVVELARLPPSGGLSFVAL